MVSIRTQQQNEQTLRTCQLAHDNAQPPEYYEDGEEHKHDWLFIRWQGDISLYRCRTCREEVVD